MIDRTELRGLLVPAVVLVGAAAVLLALAVVAVVAVAVYRTGGIMMAAPLTLAIADYLPHSTTLVPILTDGNLPVPSM